MRSNYPKTLENKKILITCGPSWIAIDPIRVISNISTGELGHRISHCLCREKAKITLLQGPVTHPLRHIPFKIISFRFFDELSKTLKYELQHEKYDIVIHAAAVSDYMTYSSASKKIKSDDACISLKLKRTPKLIESIKKISPKTILVGFKLESENKKDFLLDQSLKLIKKAKCDLVVANISRQRHYKGFIINPSRKILAIENSREKIAQKLVEILRKTV